MTPQAALIVLGSAVATTVGFDLLPLIDGEPVTLSELSKNAVMMAIGSSIAFLFPKSASLK